MKTLRLAIFLVFLCWLVSSYAVTPQEISLGEEVASGECDHVGVMYDCKVIKYNNKLYLLINRFRNTVSIYLVKKIQGNYSADEMTLVWSKTST